MRLHRCPKSPSGPLYTSALILPENLTNPRGWPGGPGLRVLNSHLPARGIAPPLLCRQFALYTFTICKSATLRKSIFPNIVELFK